MHTYWMCPGLATTGRGNNHGAAVVWNLHASDEKGGKPLKGSGDGYGVSSGAPLLFL